METKSATQMARLYGMKSSVAFNKVLVKCGILVRTVKGFVLAEGLRGIGLTTEVKVPYFLPNGIKATKKKSVWTMKGQQYVHERLARIGIVPVAERKDLFGTSSNDN